MFCCDIYRDMATDAGKNGFSVVVNNLGEGYFFMLQCREKDITQGPSSTCEQGIQFCPWCGTKLQSIIDKHPKEIEELRQQHDKLIIKF
jgi:hypothetical protein